MALTVEWFWILLVGVAFFYAIALSERSVEPEDPKPMVVVGLAMFLAWPFLDLKYLPDQAFSGAMAASFGLFIGSMLPNPILEPGSGDLPHLPVFLVKWAAGWAIQAALIAIVTLILQLLSHWTWVESFLGLLSSFLLPPVGADPGNMFLRSIVEEGVPFLALVGILAKLSRITHRSIVSALLFCFAIPFIALSFRHLATTAALSHRHLSIVGIVGGTITVDLVVSLLKAQVGQGEGFQPPF